MYFPSSKEYGCVVCGVWCVVCGVWCVVCGVWCVVCGVWCVVCGVCSMECLSSHLYELDGFLFMVDHCSPKLPEILQFFIGFTAVRNCSPAFLQVTSRVY